MRVHLIGVFLQAVGLRIVLEVLVLAKLFS